MVYKSTKFNPFVNTTSFNFVCVGSDKYLNQHPISGTRSTNCKNNKLSHPGADTYAVVLFDFFGVEIPGALSCHAFLFEQVIAGN